MHFKALALSLLLASSAAAQQPAVGPERFRPEIDAFAAQDRAAPPAPCSVLFVGSSSIRFWKTLSADMAPFPVINRGFGGSTVADVDFYFDRVVRPYRPRAIVFYAGENDLAAGRIPAAVADDFERFLALKDQAFGAIPVYFITAKPSKLRYAQMAEQRDYNDLIRRLAAHRRDLTVIDVVRPMLGADHRPKDIFVEDNLHMTPEGYRIWTAVVRPVIAREMARPTACKAA